MRITSVPDYVWKRHLPACRRRLEKGADVEEIIKLLRDRGASKIESMRVLQELLAFSISESKLAVHFSRTWSDTRKADEKLHDNVQAAVEAMLSRRKEEESK